MKHLFQPFFGLFLFLLLFGACKKNSHAPEKTLFSLLPSDSTHIYFQNILLEEEGLNIIQYLYYYNGAGVAIADFDNDNLPDIYFTANRKANALYKNKGNFQFENITENAQIGGDTAQTFKTGVTVADVNADGWADIYVCYVSEYKGLRGQNQLFINNQNGTFTEKAAEYGLNTKGLCTQSAFFDFDADGDLDCYVLRHSVHSARSYRPTSARAENDSLSSDILYENRNGKFIDVSQKAGIQDGSLGYGLGLSVADFNGDNLPDIYVGNDFHDNDYLYINNGNGTFSEKMTTWATHNSQFSMGCDAADYDNNGTIDFIGLDMKPEAENIVRGTQGQENYANFDFKNKEYGYLPQFAKNSLQRNNGNRFFQEIGQFSGVSATDWSWSALFCDLDNDGWKDLHITNGIVRRPNDLNFVKFISDDQVQRTATDLQILQQMPDGKAANYAFRNGKEKNIFENVSEKWGLNQVGFSNGSAYSDLDLDGDLDLVVNNINQTASILRNNSDSQNSNLFLKAKIQGEGKNRAAIGSKIQVFSQNMTQIQEIQPTRGFQSASDMGVLVFGLGREKTVDSVVVWFVGGKRAIVKDIQAGALIQISEQEATIFAKKTIAEKPLFKDITDIKNIAFQHQENTFYDNDKEKLIPHALSTEGAKMAIGDVNGDAMPDLWLAGAKGQAGEIWLRNRNGTYTKKSEKALSQDANAEDVGGLLFDADGDLDLDLYVVSGGFEAQTANDIFFQDRLYLNDGKGNFLKTLAGSALPTFFHNGSCVRAADVDGDDDLDLFVGSRSDMLDYGVSPTNYLLLNDGRGHFKIDPDFSLLGMVTDAQFGDVNGDTKPDLVVVGEFMPITIFYNFLEKTGSWEKLRLEHTSGWWQSVVLADIDQDKDVDIVAGNWGLNSLLHASAKEPLGLYLKDFDQNGSVEPILTYFRQGKEYTIATKDELTAQMPSLKKRFLQYDKFADATFQTIFTPEMRKGMQERKAFLLQSVTLLNKKTEGFELRPLPQEVQLSTLQSLVVQDFDRDGKVDILVGGNFREVLPAISSQDASVGCLLKGEGKGNFRPLSPSESGIFLKGAIRDIQVMGKEIFISRNGDGVKVLGF